jgi:hypothetical protein
MAAADRAVLTQALAEFVTAAREYDQVVSSAP